MTENCALSARFAVASSIESVISIERLLETQSFSTVSEARPPAFFFQDTLLDLQYLWQV